MNASETPREFRSFARHSTKIIIIDYITCTARHGMYTELFTPSVNKRIKGNLVAGFDSRTGCVRCAANRSGTGLSHGFIISYAVFGE